MPMRRAIRRRHAGPAFKRAGSCPARSSRCGMRRRPTPATHLLPDSAKRRAGASRGSGSPSPHFSGAPTLFVWSLKRRADRDPLKAPPMTIYKFTRLTMPPTLEKRLEVLEAFRTLVSQDDEHVRQRRAEIAALRREAEDIRRCVDAFRRQLPGLRAEILKDLKAQKYSPDQPRVPAGTAHGGEWTNGGSEPAGTELPTPEHPKNESPWRVVANNDPRVLSDAPDATWAPGARSAQYRARGGGWSGGRPVMVNGQLLEPTPGQAARLVIAESNWREAIARAKEVDPSWHPTPGFEETVEGLISNLEAETKEAETHRSNLACYGIGPGPFAGESIAARGPERSFTAVEREQINRIGSETGCHSCGTKEPGTRRDNFVPDHQLPSALNPFGGAQRLYPQCLLCSRRQGGWITGHGGGR